jgi:hypothetical protein
MFECELGLTLGAMASSRMRRELLARTLSGAGIRDSNVDSLPVRKVT